MGAVAGAVAAGPFARGLHTGNRHQREEQPPSDRWSRKRVRERRLATVRNPTATELRVDVIQSTCGLDHRRFIADVPAMVRLCTRRTMTPAGCRRRRGGCVGVAPRRLGSARRACEARRVSRAAHGWRQAHRGVTGARRPRATDDERRRPRSRPRPSRDRRASGPVCRGAVSAGAGRLRNDPVGAARWAGPIGWYRRSLRLGSLPDACSASGRSLCFVQSRRSQQ